VFVQSHRTWRTEGGTDLNPLYGVRIGSPDSNIVGVPLRVGEMVHTFPFIILPGWAWLMA